MTATATATAFGAGAQIVCDNLVRIFKSEGVEVVALQGLDLLVQEGEVVAIVGASGSGKSTLLNVLSGLDVPSAGVARVAGADLLTMSARDRVRYRRQTVGFLFQQAMHNLLPYLSASENIQLPMTLAGVPRRERPERAAELLDLLDIPDCGERRPSSPAANSSGWRSGWPWPTDQRCCSPTNPPASSTPRVRRKSSRPSGGPTRHTARRWCW